MADGARTQSHHTQITVKFAGWGIVLTVAGLALLIVAVHESLINAAWEAAGNPRTGTDGEQWNWAPIFAGCAVVLLVAGVWSLVVAVVRVADRADGVVRVPVAPRPLRSAERNVAHEESSEWNE